ncbi:M48 family metalloprotease [Desulfuromonas thiophila]|uniref:M48 family metalloprotease n=1 Tax=Desulfuromonas thiophila TaxID=57664 RepID=UPI0024A8B8B5|nr:M48 family metalloprotease [Desulfuromonas thiophila]
MRYALAVCTLVLLLAGCAINPVTGRNELALVGEDTELRAGAQHYQPSRQMQGGDYRTHPQVVAYVQQVGQRLAAVSDRKLPYEFRVLNDSTPNAWALPGGKIAINRGLLVELNNEAELAAVLSHEIVHAAARHGAKGMERNLLLQGAVLATGLAARNSEYAALATGGAAVGSQLIQQRYSRDAEREADAYGMRYMARAGYDPAAAIGLQQTFVRLAKNQQPDWLNGLFSSHPPSQERVEANRQLATTLPKGGTLGEERYRQALAPLLADREAYAAHDAGRKALQAKDTAKALSLAEKALRLQPAEALFHGLRGDIRMAEKNPADAITNYDRAIARDDGYFHYYLQRGLAKKALGQTSAAVADLERSTALLPTAPAQQALGLVALQQGQRGKAKELFAAAAQSQSTIGQQARQAYQRLDLPEQPQRYLTTAVGLDGKGQLVLRIRNDSSLNVRQIVCLLQFSDSRQRRQQRSLTLAEVLPAGQQHQLQTGIGPLDPATLKSLSVRVSQATLAD